MSFCLSIFSCCLPCFPDLSAPYVLLNGTKYRIVKFLAEGGFSYVYLVTLKSNSNSQFALKKIRCPFGSKDESYKNALKEIRNYHRFANSKTPYIIQSIDEYIESERDGSKTIYILLPYFERSLQDIINYNVLNDKKMEEDEIIRVFIGICRALQVMHKFKRTSGSAIGIGDEEDDLLIPDNSDEEEEPLDDMSANDTELQELIPFAHRDIKPGNVMLSAEGLPVLVDLGSCSRARIQIKNRQRMLSMMDFALEHCTLPYRPPELLDVEINSEITEKADIWSLGCLLYACCFGYSPFEKLEIEQGANLNLAISQGSYTIPADNDGYSPELMEIIRLCLQVSPESRPSVDELLEKALQLST